MFTISCEQYLLDREEAAPDGVTIVYVSNFTPIPVQDPRVPGGKALMQIGTMRVQIVMSEAERARMHELTAPRAVEQAAQSLEGDPRPAGTSWGRCGRVKDHPSHVWLMPGGEAGDDPERVEDLAWCDGRTPFSEDAIPGVDAPEFA